MRQVLGFVLFAIAVLITLTVCVVANELHAREVCDVCSVWFVFAFVIAYVAGRVLTASTRKLSDK
jgi:hypothetical protein